MTWQCHVLQNATSPLDTYASRKHDDLGSFPVQLQLLHDRLAYPARTACHCHDMLLLLLQLV
jgi:hypothetical protein